jgi:hypothetical protein
VHKYPGGELGEELKDERSADTGCGMPAAAPLTVEGQIEQLANARLNTIRIMPCVRLYTASEPGQNK